ncbi:MAG: hypothetical protein OXG85_01445 [Chloroflexi bacterium]|nr:hypothetical protein [Chloroflexota bacterium]
MKQAASVKKSGKTDRERIAEVDLDSLSERELRELYEEIFGEPSDEEIAAALREAEAEFEAGDYSPTPLAADDDDEPYREPTKRENLESLKQSWKGYLAGRVLTEKQFRDYLRVTSK